MNRLLPFGKVSDIRLGKEPAFDAWFYSFCAENNIEHSINPTGVAGPDKSEGKDVGTVCFGFAGKDRGTETVMLHFSSWGRASVRRKSATAAFILMRAFIEGKGPLIDITTKWNYI